VLPGDPLAQGGAVWALKSWRHLRTAGERSVNTEIPDNMICRNAGACEQKGRMMEVPVN